MKYCIPLYEENRTAVFLYTDAGVGVQGTEKRLMVYRPVFMKIYLIKFLIIRFSLWQPGNLWDFDR